MLMVFKRNKVLAMLLKMVLMRMQLQILKRKVQFLLKMNFLTLDALLNMKMIAFVLQNHFRPKDLFSTAPREHFQIPMAQAKSLQMVKENIFFSMIMNKLQKKRLIISAKRKLLNL